MSDGIKVTGSHLEIPRCASLIHISNANLLRAMEWHPKGIDSWSMSDWAVALAGECGELCNVVKKLNRVRDGIPGNKETPETLRAELANEIADVFLYLDLFARAANIRMEEAIQAKFNATSEKFGFPQRL